MNLLSGYQQHSVYVLDDGVSSFIDAEPALVDGGSCRSRIRGEDRVKWWVYIKSMKYEHSDHFNLPFGRTDE